MKPDLKRARRDPPSQQPTSVVAGTGFPPEAALKKSNALPVRAKSFEFSAPARDADVAASGAPPATGGQYTNDTPHANGNASGQGHADETKQDGELNAADKRAERLFGVPLPSSPEASAPGEMPTLQASPRSAFSPTGGPAARAAAVRAGPRLPDNLSPFTAMADGAADHQGLPGDDASPERSAEATAAGPGRQDAAHNLSTIASLHSWGAAPTDATSAAENAAVALLSSRMRSPAVVTEPSTATRCVRSLMAVYTLRRFTCDATTHALPQILFLI